MRLALRKGTKNFITLAILEELLVNSIFHLKKFPMVNMKVLV
jgi:hypothetical protein